MYMSLSSMGGVGGYQICEQEGGEGRGGEGRGRVVHTTDATTV